MAFDPVTWVIGWLLGRAAGAAWASAFERSDAKKRLRQSLRQWTKEMRGSGQFTDFDERTLLEALFSPRDTAPQADMRGKHRSVSSTRMVLLRPSRLRLELALRTTRTLPYKVGSFFEWYGLRDSRWWILTL